MDRSPVDGPIFASLAKLGPGLRQARPDAQRLIRQHDGHDRQQQLAGVPRREPGAG
jgi:hypothetical protein